MDSKTDSRTEEKNDFDFDLPTLEDVAPVTKPRIHIAGESTCTSCEG